MFIRQTLFDFMDNPMGRGSNALSSRKLIQSDLNSRFDVILKNKKIDFVIYRLKDLSRIYFHFKIPSEKLTRDNTYDVVLCFSVPEDDASRIKDSSIKRYEMTFFSNSPSFTYTYAYASNLYGLLIPELASKYEKIVLKSPPITRNPAEVINYEKTTYFAMRYLVLNANLLQKTIIEGNSKIFNENQFKTTIRTTAKVETEIKIAKRKEESDRKKTDIHNPRKQPQSDTSRVNKLASKTRMGKVDRQVSERRIKPIAKKGATRSTRKRT